LATWNIFVGASIRSGELWGKPKSYCLINQGKWGQFRDANLATIRENIDFGNGQSAFGQT